jgi:AraC-like DNA-binding protein
MRIDSTQAIRDRLRQILGNRSSDNSSLSLPHGGLITCRREQRISQVSFHEPGVILVVQGIKSIYFQNRQIYCRSGEMLALPAPSRFDFTNLPVGRDKPYLALFLGFKKRLVDRLRQQYGVVTEKGSSDHSYQLHVGADELLHSAILHYLQIIDTPGISTALLEHRLLDLLLCLVDRKPDLHLRLSLSASWRERVYSILLTDPARHWQVADICAQLAVSESTLRRRLGSEDENFHKILEDMRFGLALTQIQMTHLPVYEVALNCGYRSASQFTRRFRERFGVTPRALRETRICGLSSHDSQPTQ